jgi:hypothetical protein
MFDGLDHFRRTRLLDDIKSLKPVRKAAIAATIGFPADGPRRAATF